jgi:lysozyme
MKPSERSTQLTREFEQCRLVAYWDKTYIDRPYNRVKRWSIGWGYTKNVKEGDVWTREQADEFLELAHEEAANLLMHSLPGVFAAWDGQNPDTSLGKAYQWHFDALTDFVYNIGIGEFNRSRLKRLIPVTSSGSLADIQHVADEFLCWKMLNGNPCNGLLRRRHAERALFLGDFKPDGSLKLTKEDFPDAEWA